jgi:lipopolysaccharide/colanic/teichoic acid biosynthesis glycosyltransferase
MENLEVLTRRRRYDLAAFVMCRLLCFPKRGTGKRRQVCMGLRACLAKGRPRRRMQGQRGDPRDDPARRTTKRLFDVTVAAAVLLAGTPLLLTIALTVCLGLGRPVLFVQERAGRHGVPFGLVKFRTMREACGAEGRPLSDGERLTRLGSFLRSTSLDELPELWNVLRGEMSLVGPRPLLMEYLPLYTPEQARRHEVRPGITGWAQVNGRNALSWKHKFRLDVWYVDNCSFWLDVKILWLTAVKVCRREGVSQEGHATAEYFRGSC